MNASRTKFGGLNFCFSASLQVFGGVLVNLNSLLNWLSWLKYLSIFRYAIEVII